MPLASQRKPLALVVLILVLGMLIGSVLGELIGQFVVEGVVRDFFTSSITPGFDSTTLDLVVVQLTIGIRFKLNVISVVGVACAAYMLKWYE